MNTATSGSCTLPTNKQLKQFIQNYLIKIENDKYHSKMTFDHDVPEDIRELFYQIPGYLNLKDSDTIGFENMYDVENEDVGKIIKEVNNLLNTETEKELTPLNETYNSLVNNILDIGFVYSTFVEIVLANCYVNNNNKIIRYAFTDPNEDTNIYKKYSIKLIHTLVESGILSFLYEPNNQSLTKTYNKFDNIDMDKITIFERIWLGRI
ncbi:MAG: hypothetical protein H8D97_00365 [Proteobacteria bacterium]|nr:hypothetical protein [Pseudomonadota bacterium]